MIIGVEAGPLFARDAIVPPDAACAVPLADQSTAVVESFQRLDLGRGNPVDREIAKTACGNCIHRYFCASADQMQEFADAVAVDGVETVAGGLDIVAHPAARPRSVLDVPDLKFDRSFLPDDPVAQLDQVIRPATRAGQLQLGPIAPHAMAAIRNEFIERLERAHPNAITRLTERGALTARELSAVIGSTATALYRQAHFVEFAVSTRARMVRLSDPTLFDLDRAFPTIKQAVEDALAIRRQGYGEVINSTMRRSPAFYRVIAEEYVPAGLSMGMIRRVVRSHGNNPVPVLDGLVSQLKDKDTAATTTNAMMLAQKDARPELRAELAARYAGHAYVTPALINKVFASGAANPEQRLTDIVTKVSSTIETYGKHSPDITVESMVQLAFAHAEGKYAKAVEVFIANVKGICGIPGIQTFLTDHDIQSFARLHNAVTVVEKRKSAFEAMCRDSDGTLTTAQIREAAMRGITSSQEACTFMKIKSIQNRFGNRKGTIKPLPRWMTEHAVRSSEWSQVDATAEWLYTLYQEGIIVEGVGERASELPEGYDRTIEDVRHPSGKYMSYASQLASLSAFDRAALAAVTGLPIYPRLDKQRLTAMLGHNNLERYALDTILPKCRSLIADAPESSPLLLSQLAGDWRTINQAFISRLRQATEVIDTWQTAYTKLFYAIDKGFRRLAAVYNAETNMELTESDTVEQMMVGLGLQASPDRQVDESLQSWLQDAYMQFCYMTKRPLKGNHGAGIFFGLVGNYHNKQPASSFLAVWDRLTSRFPDKETQLELYDDFMREIVDFMGWWNERETRRETRQQKLQILMKIPWWDMETWRQHSACRDQPVRLFDITHQNNRVVTDPFCGKCDVRGHCLEYALYYKLDELVYGGLTPDERRGLLQRLPEQRRHGPRYARRSESMSD